MVGFLLAIAVGTVLLMLPVADEPGRDTSVVYALFTATSAVCLTGLVVVDTSQHWSTFGELVVLGLIQAGGFGIMTLASLLVLLISRRLGLRIQRTAGAEKSLGLGDVRAVVAGVFVFTALFEGAVTVILTARLWLGYDQSLGRAAYLGFFHAVSAFNNAGFSLYPDSLVRFAGDPWICLPVVVAFLAGGVGFPVLLELRRRLRKPRRWSLHTKVTVATTTVLVMAGTVMITAAEWANPDTLGPMGVPSKLLAGFFHGTTPRTAGFNSLDVGQMYPGTLLGTDALMFIGGGSAGTAGGVKVTTFALLAFVILAEIRGDPAVHVAGRRLPEGTQRQALTVALLGIGVVMISTMILLALTDFTLDAVLFETTSAFGTVGLSTGITADVGSVGHVVLTVLMFIGRLGPITLASALALRERTRRYELPEERPIVG